MLMYQACLAEAEIRTWAVFSRMTNDEVVEKFEAHQFRTVTESSRELTV